MSDGVLYPQLRLPDGSLLATVPDEPVTITFAPDSVPVARVSVYVKDVEGSLLTISPGSRQDGSR